MAGWWRPERWGGGTAEEPLTSQPLHLYISPRMQLMDNNEEVGLNPLTQAPDSEELDELLAQRQASPDLTAPVLGHFLLPPGQPMPRSPGGQRSGGNTSVDIVSL